MKANGRIKIFILALAILSTSLALWASKASAQESEYIEILEGDMPLVLNVGHGGWKPVGELENGGWSADPLLQAYFYQVLAVRIYERTGHLPYIVYLQGNRNYVNVNRWVGSSQAYHPNNLQAKAVYYEFHDQVDAMIVRVEGQYGANMALMVNPHTTDLPADGTWGRRPWDRITEIGFGAPVGNLGVSYNTMKALYNRMGQEALIGQDSIPYMLFHAQHWSSPDPPWPPVEIINSKTLAKYGDDVWHVLPAINSSLVYTDTTCPTGEWCDVILNGGYNVRYHGTNTSGHYSLWPRGLDAFQMEVNYLRGSGLSLHPDDPEYDPAGPYYQLDVVFTTRFMDHLIDAILYSLEVNYGWTPGGVHNIIVDNGDPGFSATGVWQDSSGDGSWNTLSVWSDSAGDTATWTPNITQTGTYEVLVRWTDTGNRACDAGYTVNYAGGTQSFTLDQSGGLDAKWVSLGYFPFDAGAGGNVVLTCSGTGNSTSADAVLFRLDASPPLVPDLQSPANGVMINDSTCVLAWWSPSLDVAGYWLDWNGAVMDVTATIEFTTPVLADGVYTWTVSAYDHVGNTSVYANVYSFTVDTTPPEPSALVSPTNNALFSDTTPTLVWESSPSVDVLGYRLNFSGTIVDVGNTTRYTTSVLTADGVYTWTVAPCDQALNMGIYTDVWSFTLDATPPTMPVLLAPANGLLVSDTHLSLIWSASSSPDVAGYVLNWNDVITDVGDTTTYSVNVQADGVYTWSVAAYDAPGNTSAYTDISTFTLDATPPQVQQMYPADGDIAVALDAPLLITFSESLLTDTLVYTFTPDPGGWTAVWNDDATALTLGHALFAHLTSYTASVAGVRDPAGNAMDSFHWAFTTEPPACAPVTGVTLTQTAPSEVYPGDIVTFSADLAADDAGKPYHYRLTIDGAPGLEQTSETDPLVFTGSFEITGVHQLDIAVWNCDLGEAQAVTAHLELQVQPSDVCITLDSISILGEMGGAPGEYVFESQYEPQSATPPINYLWGNGDEIASSLRTLGAGMHTLVVTATNCPITGYLRAAQSLVTDTHVITISEPVTCTQVTQVNLAQISTGTLYMGDWFALQASILPNDASTPYTYTLNYGDESATVTAVSSQNPLALTHTYTMSGDWLVELAVWNCTMSSTKAVSDTLLVHIEQPVTPPEFWIFLPVVIKQE